MIKLDKNGYVINGLAYKRCGQRRERQTGAQMAFTDGVSQNCFDIAGGWFKMTKEVKMREIGDFGRGQIEVGFRRITQLVFPELLKKKEKFRLKSMRRWIEGISAAEFGVSSKKGRLTDLSILEGDCVFGLCAPKASDDRLYEIRYGVKMGSCSGRR